MRFAILADIHGNRWALEAVLEALDRIGVSEAIDLGDCLFGPLDPGGTLELLRRRRWPTVRGNMDRMLLEPAPSPPAPTHRLVLEEIGEDGVEWIRAETRAPFGLYDAYHCHGTPERDDKYLVEAVGADGVVRAREPAALDGELGGVSASLVSCGHSHRPWLLESAAGATVVNPGSVGLPAYEEGAPVPHAMESGSPHARFAVVESHPGGWSVQHLAEPYDQRTAAGVAQRNGRADWHAWLLTGRAGER